MFETKLTHGFSEGFRLSRKGRIRKGLRVPWAEPYYVGGKMPGREVRSDEGHGGVVT